MGHLETPVLYEVITPWGIARLLQITPQVYAVVHMPDLGRHIYDFYDDFESAREQLIDLKDMNDYKVE